MSARAAGNMELLPAWTAAGSWTLGRDPLGMQATSVRMYRSLVPGLTNVTNRLRYYSYYCWVIERYEATEHSGDDARWKTFIRRAEALYALACNLADPERADGLAGNIWASGIAKSLEGGSFDVRPATSFQPGIKQYLGAKRGNFGQFYTASMTEEGFLSPSRRIPIVSPELGKRAASAFASSVGGAGQELLDAIREGEVTVAGLRAIGEVVHPSCIPLASGEMQLLRSFLLSDDSGSKSGQARRASCWLLLDLLSKGVSADDEPAIRRALYNGRLPDNSDYTAPGSTAAHWRAYQANELCHIAFEAVLNGLLARLERKTRGEDPDTLIKETLEPTLSALGAIGSSWQHWAEGVATAHAGKEDKLAEPILEALADAMRASDLAALENAVRLVAVLWKRWASGEAGVRDAIGHSSAKGGRSLAGVIQTLDRCADAPTLQALIETIRRHVIADHLMVAGRKLAASGTFTYHFTSTDGLLNNGRIGTYRYTTPRLRNLLRFLADAGLRTDDGITEGAKEFLNACQPL